MPQARNCHLGLEPNHVRADSHLTLSHQKGEECFSRKHHEIHPELLPVGMEDPETLLGFSVGVL